MNQNKNNKAFTFLWVALLIVILLQLFLLVKTHKPVVNNYIGQKGDTGQSIVGPQGVSGAQGLPGIGLQGPAGQSGAPGVTQITNNNTNIAVPGPQGDKGDKGDPAIVVPPMFKVDANTCQLETKYPDDDFWTTLAQLPSPCEVK